MTTTNNVSSGLRGIGFRTPEVELLALLKDATKRRLSPAQVCEHLVKQERRIRDERNLEGRTRMATLGKFKPIDEFDWNHPKTIDREQFEWLSTLEFIDQGRNVLLRGQSGVGKTTLAQNLGQLALLAGYSVKFMTLATALADLLRQESLPALDRRLKRYSGPGLLILDELGYLPCDNRAADMLYTIISARHEQCSTVITTNLAFKQWSKVFPGAACVGALVDRFIQHCDVLDIDADSWRQKDAAQAKKSRRTKKTRK